MRPERVYFLNLYNVGLWFMVHWSLNNKNTGFGLSIYILEMKISLEFLEIFCNTFLKCLWNKLFTRLVFCKMACTELRNEKCFKSSRNLPLSLPYQLFFPCYEDYVFFPKSFNVQFWNSAFHYQLNTLISCDNQFLDFGFTFNLTVPIFFACHFNKKQCVYHAPK